MEIDIQPVKSRRTSEIILEQIKKLIVDGKLKAGDKLPTEMELAGRFGVSRTSIREALSALSLTGILEIRQGEGIYVKTPPSTAVIEPLAYIFLLEKGKVQNILEVRKALEVEAAGLAAERRDEQDLARMAGLIQAMERDLPEAKNSAQLDLEFHLAIAHASKNPLLDRLMNTVQETISQTVDATRALWMSATKEDTSHLFAEHRLIFEAISERSKEKARAVMYEHLRKVETALVELNQDIKPQP